MYLNITNKLKKCHLNESQEKIVNRQDSFILWLCKGFPTSIDNKGFPDSLYNSPKIGEGKNRYILWKKDLFRIKTTKN